MDRIVPDRFEYARDDVRHRIRITAHDALNADELMAIVDRQVRERTWAYAMLYDLRAYAAVSRFDAIMVAAHVESYLKAYGPRGPVAVCAKTIEMLGAGQRYAIDATKFGLNVEVFSEVKSAERWLDTQQSDIGVDEDGTSNGGEG